MKSVRRFRLGRWTGTTSDVAAVANLALRLVDERTEGDTPLLVLVDRGMDEEQYETVEEFEREVLSDRAEIKRIRISAGSAAAGLVATAIFATEEKSAVTGEVEGPDRVVNQGVRDELARQVNKGRRLIPAPNAIVGFLIFGILGTGLGYLFASVDFSFLPSGTSGAFVYAALYLAAVGLLLFGGTAAIRWLLPSLELLLPGEEPRFKHYKRMVGAAAGFVVVTVAGILIKRLVGGD